MGEGGVVVVGEFRGRVGLNYFYISFGDEFGLDFRVYWSVISKVIGVDLYF